MLHRNGVPMLLALVAIGAGLRELGADAGPDMVRTKEPPFPDLLQMNQLGSGARRARIVSEVVSEESGYETTIEYLDFDLCKSSLVVSGKHGFKSTYVDSATRTIYHYKPYSCMSLEPADVSLAGYTGLWSANTTTRDRSGQEREVHLYGVAAVWFNAGQMAKAYSTESGIYSASKDATREAHKWTIEDEKNQNLVHLYFTATRRVGATKSQLGVGQLEMIQVEGALEGRITRTINILTVDNEIPKELYDSVLQVPVGYGCETRHESSTELRPSDLPFHLWHRIELEITATKMADSSSSAGGSRSSDTVSVELAIADHEQGQGADVMLLRQRDSTSDTKTVLNYRLNVQYTIDMRLGTCRMDNIQTFARNASAQAERATSTRVVDDADDVEHVKIAFKNGLQLDAHRSFMQTIFNANLDNFNFIKRSMRSSALAYDYYELTSRDLIAQRVARIVRAYSIDLSGHDEVSLESVTLILLDEQSTRIMETYHFNVISARRLQWASELAKVFDVSEQCYLNNDAMKHGRDFAWIQLVYPIASAHEDLLTERTEELRQLFYTNKLLISFQNYLRIPRVEFYFDEISLIVRCLLLDVPPLQHVYTMSSDTSFTPDLSAGDSKDLAVDLEHCVDLCRLNMCQMMAYCEGQFSCLLSPELPSATRRRRVGAAGCRTYQRPEQLHPVFLFYTDLHSTLAELQHQDFSDLNMPQMPEELRLPRASLAAGGLDEAAYETALGVYMSKLRASLLANGALLPDLCLQLSIDGQLVVLLPGDFRLEEDPLAEFGLAQDEAGLSLARQQEDLSEAAAFHEGLTMHRYKMVAVRQHEPGASIYTGLTYDQCALACVDSRCSSFSYCRQRQDCILTNLYGVSSALGQQLIEADSDCAIMQRDFLSKFHRFPNVLRPDHYERSSTAFNPSECAHTCRIETAFNCLAFDFCRPASSSSAGARQLGTCFFFDNRLLYTGLAANESSARAAAKAAPASSASASASTATGCDHYSRSYLADFVRIPKRELEPTRLLQFRTTQIEQRSVDQCADMCVNELADCTAFQFCFARERLRLGGALQTCTFVQARAPTAETQRTNDRPPANNARGAQQSFDDNSVLVNATADGQILKEGKLFAPNDDCQVFALRADSAVARLRELAIHGRTTDQLEPSAPPPAQGWTLVSALVLFLKLAFVSALLGFGFTMLMHHSDFVRTKVDRLRLLAGI